MSEENKNFGPEDAKKLIEEANRQDVETCQGVIQDALKFYGCDFQFVETRVNGNLVDAKFVLMKANVK